MIRGVRTDSRGGRGPADPPAVARSFHLGRTVRGSPYYPALSHPVLRRVLPGAAASALGDGMSAVAIAWLALKLAPDRGPQLAAHPGRAAGHRARRADRGGPRRPRDPARLRPGHGRARPDHRGDPGRARPAAAPPASLTGTRAGFQQRKHPSHDGHGGGVGRPRRRPVLTVPVLGDQRPDHLRHPGHLIRVRGRKASGAPRRTMRILVDRFIYQGFRHAPKATRRT